MDSVFRWLFLIIENDEPNIIKLGDFRATLQEFPEQFCKILYDLDNEQYPVLQHIYADLDIEITPDLMSRFEEDYFENNLLSRFDLEYTMTLRPRISTMSHHIRLDSKTTLGTNSQELKLFAKDHNLANQTGQQIIRTIEQNEDFLDEFCCCYSYVECIDGHRHMNYRNSDGTYPHVSYDPHEISKYCKDAEHENLNFLKPNVTNFIKHLVDTNRLIEYFAYPYHNRADYILLKDNDTWEQLEKSWVFNSMITKY